MTTDRQMRLRKSWRGKAYCRNIVWSTWVSLTKCQVKHCSSCFTTKKARCSNISVPKSWKTEHGDTTSVIWRGLDATKLQWSRLPSTRKETTCTLILRNSGRSERSQNLWWDTIRCNSPFDCTYNHLFYIIGCYAMMWKYSKSGLESTLMNVVKNSVMFNMTYLMWMSLEMLSKNVNPKM